jgi:hypothetical protein
MIKVGSIVEGVEDCTESYSIFPDKVMSQSYFYKYHRQKGEGQVVTDYISKTFWELIGQVNKEAGEIWNRTHGCHKCAEHFNMNFTDNIGAIAVWKDCPECDGEGVVI